VVLAEAEAAGDSCKQHQHAQYA